MNQSILTAGSRTRYSCQITTMTSNSVARLRTLVLTHYSGGTPRCARCGVSADLGIDHIRSRVQGNRPRSGRDVGARLWRRLRDEGFPTGYQVLCRSCNSSKGGYGIGHRPTLIHTGTKRKGNQTIHLTKFGFTGTPEWVSSERQVETDPHLRRWREVRLWQRGYEQLRREVLHRYRAGNGSSVTLKTWEQATKRAAESLVVQLSA